MYDGQPIRSNEMNREKVPHNELTVVGEGRVSLRPNFARITLGVITENRQLAIAQTENNVRTEEVIHALIQEGIFQNHIQTTEFQINNVYDYVNGKQVFRGYEVRHLLEIRVNDLQKLGAIVDKAVTSGANQVFYIQFDSTLRPEKYQQALEAALKNALQKALTIANTYRIQLYPLPYQITEITNIAGSPVPLHSFSVEKVASTPIQPGSIEVVAQVQVKYTY